MVSVNCRSIKNRTFYYVGDARVAILGISFLCWFVETKTDLSTFRIFKIGRFIIV